MLTTYDTDNEIYRAIKAGAKGYLLKDARREELLDCIRKVNRGETCIPQALVEKLAAGMSSETLTGRELGVLTLLARGKSNKATRRESLHQRDHCERALAQHLHEAECFRN